MTDLIHLSLLKTQESKRLDWRYAVKRRRKSRRAFREYIMATVRVLAYEVGV